MILTIDGRRIGYDDSGGAGVPVVLLHGFPLDRTVWNEQLAALAAAGARVTRGDPRGCGESEPSDGPALMEALAGDVAGVLDALQVERAALVGHSIGGYVALAFFRMYEERVAGLALVASHVAEDASRNANADPAQRELAAGPGGPPAAVRRGSRATSRKTRRATQPPIRRSASSRRAATISRRGSSATARWTRRLIAIWRGTSRRARIARGLGFAN